MSVRSILTCAVTGSFLLMGTWALAPGDVNACGMKHGMSHQSGQQSSEQGAGHQMHGGHHKGMHSEGCGGGKHAGMKKHGGSGCGMMQVETAPAEIIRSEAPGAIQFVQACSQCHGIPDPAQHAAEEWDDVFDRMLTKMERHGMALPEEKDQKEILTFLKANAEDLF